MVVAGIGVDVLFSSHNLYLQAVTISASPHRLLSTAKGSVSDQRLAERSPGLLASGARTTGEVWASTGFELKTLITV